MRAAIVCVLIGFVAVACGSDDDGAGGLPDPVRNCSDLCQYQPVASSQQTDCAAQQTILKGYPLTTTSECHAINSISKCLDCYGALKMSASDCADLGATCL